MKTINISTLKAKASALIKDVRKGGRLVIVVRDIPVAELVPFQGGPELVITSPRRGFALPVVSVTTTVDPLDHLMEDRGRR